MQLFFIITIIRFRGLDRVRLYGEVYEFLQSLTDETENNRKMMGGVGGIENYCRLELWSPAKYWTNILDYPPGHISDSTA